MEYKRYDGIRRNEDMISGTDQDQARRLDHVPIPQNFFCWHVSLSSHSPSLPAAHVMYGHSASP